MRHLLLLPLSLCLAFVSLSCNRQLDEEKIREEATDAHRLAIDYLHEQHNLRAQLLEEKIKLIDANIEKLNDVSSGSRESIGAELRDPLVKLQAEKALYQQKMDELNRKMNEAQSLLEDQWKDYFQRLNVVLGDTKDYLEQNVPGAIVPE